jgi:hypothetical protein
MAKGKTLFVTDFDDTLAQTDATVYLTRASGEKIEMTPEKYATYEEQPGDQFDFSEFNELINPRPIKRFTRLLKKVVGQRKADKVVVLTARRHTRPVAQFLRMAGINSGVSIAALGDANPQKKADYIDKHIQRDGYTRVAFVDDSPKNVEAVDRLKVKYPNVKILTHKVTHHPITNDPTGDARPDTPPSDKALTTKLLNSTVRNPQTGNDILVRTAIKYSQDHPAYQAAVRLIAAHKKQHN